MKNLRKSVSLWAAAFAIGLSGAASAEIYLREGDQQIDVRFEGGKLYCTRISDGFEMCNGMTENADGTWGGKKMKHPDMPGFMRFRGTVTFGQTRLKIEGCALGMCQAEIWEKQAN